MPEPDYKLFYQNVKIHFEMLCTEEIRHHGYVSKDHDLAFQVFRVLSGYNQALEEIEKLTPVGNSME